MFNEVLNVKLDFPAEYLYAALQINGSLRTLKITLIGSRDKLD